MPTGVHYNCTVEQLNQMQANPNVVRLSSTGGHWGWPHSFKVSHILIESILSLLIDFNLFPFLDSPKTLKLFSPVCSSALWQFSVVQVFTAAKSQVSPNGTILISFPPQNEIPIKSESPFRMGLLPVFVLLLHNTHHHRLWGLCCFTAGAQLDP